MIFGDDNDLEIFHNSSNGNTIIQETTGGNLVIKGSNLFLQSASGEDFFKGTANGAVELYYDDTKKFETTGAGVTITGETDINGDLNVSGVSTFTGAIDANGSLDVDGHTELDDVNVSGASTFTGPIDANGSLDVDGHTELDDVNVSGASTFTGAADFNGDVDVDGHTELDDLNVSGILTATTLDVTGGGGQANLSNLSVSGFSTFTGAADFNGDIDVDGHTELDNLNVSGVSTFVGVATFSTNDVYVAQRLFVGGVEVGGTTNTFAGINTFTDTTDNTLGDSNTGAVQINGGLGVDKNVSVGAGLSVGEGITVAGLSTFVGLSTFSNGDVFIAQRLFVGGLEVEGGAGENVFSGISTFTNQTDNVLGNSDTGATHFNGGIGIDKNATVGAGLSVVAGFEVGGISTFTGNIDANGNLDVDGHTELDDVNVSGAITATTFTGNLAGTVNTTAQPNITSLGTLTGLDVNGHTELDNVNASGISSATAFANFDYLQAPFGSTVTFTVTVASKDATHRYNGTGSGSGYLINGVQAPFLTLTPGRTYRFTNDNTGSHPLKFYLEADKTTEYTSGVSFQNTYTEITVSDQTPVVLHYQCTAHGYMGNAVQVNSNVVNTNYAATLRDSLTVSGDINANGNIVGDTATNISGINNVSVSGISSATAFADFDYLQAPFGSTVNLSVVVGSKDSTHRYNGTGSGSAYIINGVQSPFLTLTPGRTYRFNLSSSDQSSHPFRFYLEADKTTEYTTNVTTASTYTEITITDETPVVLHYQCSAHGYMGNAVQTNSNVVNTNYAATLRDSLTVSGNINANGNIVGDNSTNITGIDGVTASTLSGTLQTAAQTNITSVGTLGSLTVSGDINANGNIVGDNSTNITGIDGVTATSLNITNKLTTTGIGISVANSGLRTAYIEGPEEIWIDPHPAGAGATSGSVRIRGDLYVDGTEFIVDVDKIELGDFNIGIASTVPTNALLDGAGLGIGAESIRKTITWNNATSALMSSENWNLASGKHYEIAGTDVLTSTTLGSGVVNSSLTSVGTLIGLDVNGHTELDNVNVSGVSTFAGNIDLNAALDVSGNITGTGDLTLTDTDAGSAAGPELKLYRNSASPADADYLGQIKFAGESDTGVERNYAKITGKILDASNGTEDGIIEFAHIKAGSQTITGRFRSDSLQLLNGTALSVDGDITATSDINANGNIVGDNSTNISGINQVTATTFSGNATSATTATNLAGGDTGDIPYQSSANTTTFVDASSASVGQVLIWGGSAPTWSPVSSASGNFGGITLQEEGSTVGTAGSVSGLNFIGSNVTAAAGSGSVVGSVTISDTPTFGSLKVTGISTIPSVTGPTTFTGGDVNVGTAVTIDPTSGIISATAFYGSGENLTDLINQRIEGLQVYDEGTAVGTGYTFAGLDFVGPGVTVTSTGIGTTATITIPGFGSDADGNLFAGTCAGGTYDPSSASACFNIFLGTCAGKCITEGDNNVILGNKAGCQITTGNNNTFLGNNVGTANTSGIRNVFIGNNAGAANTTGGYNNMIGNGAGQYATVTGNDNTFLGTYAGKCATGGSCNNFIGRDAGFNNTTGRQNNFIGHVAGVGNTTGSCNNMIGVGAGRYATVTGQHNNFFGTYAGKNASGAGCYNNFIGFCAGFSNTTGDCNVFIGNHAGTANTTAQRNIMIGDGAGDCATLTNSHNVFLGSCTGKCATGNSCYNNFIGHCVGFSIDGGSDNNFFGRSVGVQNTTGSNNTFIGLSAGYNNTSGNGNNFIGQDVGIGNTTGSCNNMIGRGAGRCATVTGQNNTFLGTYAGKCATGAGNCNNIIGFCAGRDNQGTMNNFMGRCAGILNTSGGYNNFFGERAGSGNGTAQTGSHNNFFGSCSGCSNQSGGCNNFFGRGTGKANLTGSQNVYIGDQAGGASTASSANVMIGKCTGVSAVVTGSDNIFLGTDAGKCASGSGTCNTFIGRNAGLSNSSGSLNNFIGKEAGCANTIGGSNVFLGHRAGNCNTEGDLNVFIGSYAGRKNTTAHDNVFLGNQAGVNATTGCYNIFFGKCSAAGGTVTGGCNVAMGRCAGYNLTTGCDNVFLGYDAGYTSADASRNVFIGQQAGCTNTSGDNNIAIGYQVSLPSATGSCQLAIGNGSDRWIAGDSSFNVTVSTASTFSSSGINVVGVVTATSFEGDGSNLTGIAADKIFEGNTEVETVDTGSNGHIKFTTEGSERARIDASGRMGIGVTNPVAKLEVNVGSAVTAFDIQGSAGQLFSVTNNLTSGSIFSVNDVSGIPSIDVDANGTIQLAPFGATEFVGVGTTNPTTKLHVVGEVTATDFNSTSDARLKTNVQVIDDPLAKVLQINGVSFNWVENNKPSMGVIADNIQEVLPELVSDTDPKTVNYNGLIGLLIEVVKDQQTQINSLNERLSQLE